MDCINKGNAYLEDEQYANAMTEYTTAFDAGLCKGAHAMAMLYHDEDSGYYSLSEYFYYIEKSTQMKDADGFAFFLLAYAYEIGEGCDKDVTKAIELYKKAVEMGDASAMNYLGCIYCEGNSVEQNYIESAKYYNMAIEKGNSDALYHMGSLYKEGHGVNKDEKKAFELCKRSADAGNIIGYYNLGKHYEHGVGCEQDIDMAINCYGIASEQGLPEATRCFMRLYDSSSSSSS